MRSDGRGGGEPVVPRARFVEMVSRIASLITRAPFIYIYMYLFFLSDRYRYFYFDPLDRASSDN